MNTNIILKRINENKVIIIIILLIILLSFLSPVFHTYENIVNVVFEITVEGIIAIGMTILILQKNFDLSVGSNLALAATVAILLQRYGPVVTIIGAILASSLAGLINGIMVSYLRFNSFVATLAMMFFLKGLVFYIVNGETVKGITQYYYKFGYGTLLKIPYPAIVFLVLITVSGILLSKTKLGRHIYAIGGNPIAAQYFGINEKAFITSSFVLTGALCGIAGLIIMTRVNIASGALGLYTNIDVIAAVIIGGTLFSGGYGDLFKTFQGILVLGIIANGMTLLNIQSYLQQVIKGFLLVLVIVIDSIVTVRRK